MYLGRALKVGAIAILAGVIAIGTPAIASAHTADHRDKGKHHTRVVVAHDSHKDYGHNSGMKREHSSDREDSAGNKHKVRGYDKHADRDHVSDGHSKGKPRNDRDHSSRGCKATHDHT